MKTQTAALLFTAILLLGSFSSCAPSRETPPALSHTAEEPPPVEAMEKEGLVNEVSLYEEAAPPPVEQPDPSPNLESMMDTVDTLCQEPRPLGSPAEYRAAQFLRDRLREYGYESHMEPFSYNITRDSLSERFRQVRSLKGEAFFTTVLPGDRVDGDSQNVVGKQREEKEQILVLSAHYDSTPDSIGVVDNASGVAVVLEAARILAGQDLPFSIRVVFFGGEEEILVGSRHHLLAMDAEERDQVAWNITVDTLAYTQEEDFEILTPLSLSREDTATLSTASSVAAAFLADSRVTPSFYSQFVSDHVSFAAAGIDSVNFGQSMETVAGLINSPADTYDLLVPELLPVAAQLLVDAVWELADAVEQ